MKLTKYQKIRCLEKLKSKVTNQENKYLYPTGSHQGKFCGTGKNKKKKSKFPINGNFHDLLLRPIVSNINTSTCNLKSFLSKLLLPLLQSHHNIKSTKDFIQNMKREIINPKKALLLLVVFKKHANMDVLDFEINLASNNLG